MPIRDRAERRAYQRNWLQARRAEFFSGKTCHFCGDIPARPVLHHLDPAAKESHHVWSWSQARREAELEKCVVACRDCHNQYHAAEQRQTEHGTASMYRRCKCAECRAYNRDRVRASRAAHRASSRTVSPLPV